MALTCLFWHNETTTQNYKNLINLTEVRVFLRRLIKLVINEDRKLSRLSCNIV